MCIADNSIIIGLTLKHLSLLEIFQTPPGPHYRILVYFIVCINNKLRNNLQIQHIKHNKISWITAYCMWPK